jgi:hypothetical protein
MTSARTLLALFLLMPSIVRGADPCPRDSVRVGGVCVDRYEASV